MALPAGTVTFLFSDVEGSTQLARTLGERYPGVLEEHGRLLRAAFAEHGGHVVDTQGDSFFVTFPRARDAVLAAADVQHALVAHPWPEEAELRVRIGLHTGEAAMTDDRYLGVAVHHASRVCSAGHGGQVLLSQSTAAVLEDERLDGIGVRELGHHQLKDFDRPERIFQLVIPGCPSEFPPLRAQYHLGRLIDHVHLRVRDLEASKRFYGSVLEARTSPGPAIPATRAPVWTAIPRMSEPSNSSSPVWSPKRIWRPSTRAASRIDTAHTTARAGPSKVARKPSPAVLSS